MSPSSGSHTLGTGHWSPVFAPPCPRPPSQACGRRGQTGLWAELLTAGISRSRASPSLEALGPILPVLSPLSPHSWPRWLLSSCSTSKDICIKVRQSYESLLATFQTLERACKGGGVGGVSRGSSVLLPDHRPPACSFPSAPPSPGPFLLPMLRPSLSARPAQCPGDMVFRSAEQCRRDGGPCPQLCLAQDPGVECTSFCAPGCACLPGLFLHNASCLPRSRCPCQLHGQLYAPGAVARLDSCNNW